MAVKKPLSRRTFLKGSGNIAIAIPFLDAMIPTFARAQSAPQYRWVNLYYGSCYGGTYTMIPSSYGALTAPLKASVKSLESVKQHITMISHLNLPQHNSGVIPPPGEAVSAQHGKMESPLLSGVRSVPKTATQFDNIYSLIRGTTADQYVANFLGSGSKYKSLQMRLQAADYNGRVGNPKAMSVIKNGTVLNELPPVISPLKMYEMLFSGGLPNTTQPPISSLPLKKKSALDLVLDDANRLIQSVSGTDKERLELHFHNIREMEKSLGSITSPMQPSSGTCTAPQKPGADPAVDDYGFGGWANETLRGKIQVELIAHAIQCGLTHVVSWALTYPQVWLNSYHTGGSTILSNSGKADIHSDSHQASGDVIAANHDWAVNFFGMLVKRLSEMNDGHGSLLDHTFVSFVAAEGQNAHNRSNLSYLAAGCPHRIKNGHHINGANRHPARLFVSGMQAIGMNTNNLNEVSGNISDLHI